MHRKLGMTLPGSRRNSHDRSSMLRALAVIFSIAALVVVLVGVAGVVALQVTVRSKHSLVGVYEGVARQVEQAQVASERRARKLRTALLLATPSEIASHGSARDDLQRRLEVLAAAGPVAQLGGDVRALQEVETRLSAAEDRLVAALGSTTSDERIALFAREVQPPREDLDEAMSALARAANDHVAEARRASDRTDALAFVAVGAALALALLVIAALAASLRTTLRRLGDAQRRLDEATAFQQQLMGIVGHDIRSPVTAILLGAHRLAKKAGDAGAVERYRASIVRNATRVERIAGLLMDVTRFQAGLDIPISPAAGDLHQSTGVLVDEARAANPDRVIDFDHDGDGWAWFDDDRIAQVVSNLINNAVRHSPPGTPISVRSKGTPAAVEVSVHNDGQIDERVLPRVFEPFAKGGPNVDRFSAGLGLYVAKKLVEAHHGTISIGAAGGGTTVTVRLPRGEGHQPAALH